jgi:lipase maturation factor 1
MGLAYVAAFFSLSGQIIGLIGHHGILPADTFLESIKSGPGAASFATLPTAFWLNCSDGFLQSLCIAGGISALLAVLGIYTGPGLLLSWFFYLSIVNVGQDFLSFQWDILLLETGFLAIFLAPWQAFEPPWQFGRFKAASPEPSLVIIWLMRWLLFRLIFESGMVKLASGDKTWANLTALNYHYYTQPLPTPLAWYAQQLPEWFQKFSVGSVFFIELIVPFLIFTPRTLRRFAGFAIILLQVLIALTGNYAFFNLLTIALCLLLLDDQAIARFLFGPLVERISAVRQPRWPTLQKGICLVVAVFIGFLSVGNLLYRARLPFLVQSLLEPTERYYFLNGYGLFAVMTTSRLEIEVQGSADGKEWRVYKFKYKPEDVQTAPPIVAPHQPRLDWQMWFAALSDWRTTSWFPNLMTRLLQGEPSVLNLLESNPFPDGPPTYVRADLYRYTFTNFQEKAKTGDWWHRQYAGEYFPVASLRAGEQHSDGTTPVP